MEDNLH